MGILIEHFAGAFPLWLAPVQVGVLCISQKYNDYASQVLQQLQSAGLRAQVNLSGEKIGAKIRDATLQKVPYMLILGEREQQSAKVAVRHRTQGDQGQLSLEEFIRRCQEEIATRGMSAAG
jgi:threonyl-tRNA synthetase